MKLNIETLVSTITGARIDITGDFNDWTKVAFAIASEYGEGGREYFHQLARMSPTYKKGENDSKYDNALKTGKKTNISTLIYIAKKNGVDVSSAYIKDLAEIDDEYVFVAPVKQDTFNQKEFKGMSQEWVEKAHSLASESTLYKGMTNLSFLKNKAVIGDIFSEYRVGALNSDTTVFWQIDIENKIRNGKTIPYKEDLHRDKTKGANWIHALKKMENYKYKQCLFGENVFSIEKYKNAQMVFVVESEKTALICNIIYRNNPEFVWVASGGYQNITDSAMKDLKGKFFKLFADKDAQGAWETKRLQLVNKGYNVEMVNWQKMFPEGTEIGGKDDIADVILRSDRDALLGLRTHLEGISCFS